MYQHANVSRSGYYKWLSRNISESDIENSEILNEILNEILFIHDKVKGIYGYRRMTMNVNIRMNKVYNLKRIYRIMKENNIKSRIRRKKKNYKYHKPQIIAENLLAREFNSDRGYQYTHKDFKEKLDKFNATQSMSRPGKCIDNGPMEGFFGILKSEMFYLNKYDNLQDLEHDIDKYIDFYNNDRYQKNLKNLSPNQYWEQILDV